MVYKRVELIILLVMGGADYNDTKSTNKRHNTKRFSDLLACKLASLVALV